MNAFREAIEDGLKKYEESKTGTGAVSAAKRSVRNVMEKSRK